MFGRCGDGSLLTAVLKQLELRWTELNDPRMIGTLMSRTARLSPSLMDKLEDKVNTHTHTHNWTDTLQSRINCISDTLDVLYGPGFGVGREVQCRGHPQGGAGVGISRPSDSATVTGAVLPLASETVVRT